MQYSVLSLLGLLAPVAFASPTASAVPVAVSKNLQSGFFYYGCWTDDTSDRELHSDHYTDATGMTENSCISYCSGKGYTWAGVEFGSECYCGFGLESQSKKAPESDCSYSCSGKSGEACGGSQRLSVFTSGKIAAINKPLVNGYYYSGCYTDSAPNRALTYVAHNDTTSKTMSNEFCTSTCRAAGYKYAGTEYAGECYCGNTISGGNQPVSGNAVDSGCDYRCNGASTEWCGGAGRLSLYSTIFPGAW